MTAPDKLFSPSQAEVIEAADCTWCGARAGDGCLPPTAGKAFSADLPGGPGTAHAMRWNDLWNLRHPDEQKPVMRRGGRS